MCYISLLTVASVWIYWSKSHFIDCIFDQKETAGNIVITFIEEETLFILADGIQEWAFRTFSQQGWMIPRLRIRTVSCRTLMTESLLFWFLFSPQLKTTDYLAFYQSYDSKIRRLFVQLSKGHFPECHAVSFGSARDGWRHPNHVLKKSALSIPWIFFSTGSAVGGVNVEPW